MSSSSYEGNGVDRSHVPGAWDESCLPPLDDPYWQTPEGIALNDSLSGGGQVEDVSQATGDADTSMEPAVPDNIDKFVTRNCDVPHAD